jgi:DUF4097 and DUF4098 domain-containing protein YvlB
MIWLALQPSAGMALEISEILEVQAGQRLLLRTDIGKVEVSGYSGTEVKILVDLQGMDDDEFSVDIAQDDAGVRVDGDLSKRFFVNFSHRRVTFDIRVPRKFDVDVQTRGGSVSVVNIAGSVEVHTSGGSMNFQDIVGNVNGKTSGGSGDVENVNGDLDLDSSGGGFDINGVTGKVELHTSGGSIRAEQITGSINASTSGGSIIAGFSGELSNDSDLSTSGGAVTAYLQPGIGIFVDARSSGGSVKSDFSINGVQRKHRLRGSINGGGPRLNLESSGGGIRIREI